MKSLPSLWFAAIAGITGRRSRLAQGAAGSLVLKIVNTLLLLLTGVLLTRLLGAKGFGVYSFAMAVIMVLSVPTQFGLPVILVRYIAVYHLREQWPLLRGLLQSANQLVLGLALGFVALGGAALWLFADHISQASLNTFAWALWLLPLLGLGALRGAALRGLHQVLWGQVPELLVKPGLLLGLLSAAYLAKDQVTFTPSWAMGMNLIAASVAFILGAWWLWRRLPKSVKQSRPAYECGAWARSALPICLTGGLAIINNQTDMILLGLLRTTEEVGVYRTAVVGASLVAFALTAINPVLAPTFSRLYAQGDLTRLQRIVTLSARIMLLVSLPIALALMVWGKSLLGAVFGPEFMQGHVALAILCIGQLFNVGMGSVGLLLTMTGHEKDTAHGIAVATIINVILNAILIPFFGIEGAALANMASMITWNILLAIWVERKLGIDSTALAKY